MPGQLDDLVHAGKQILDRQRQQREAAHQLAASLSPERQPPAPGPTEHEHAQAAQK